MVAICSNCSSDEIFSELSLSVLSTCFTPASIPRLISTAFAPSLSLEIPPLTNSRANKVEVVVPSPAWSAVLIAACFTICAPKSSIGSSKDAICFATLTPSLVETTIPFSVYTTFLPLGPSVATTASAKVSIPFTSFLRASGPNSIILLIVCYFC